MSIATTATRDTNASWAAVGTLWRRELVRFFRQRNRVIGALGTPIVFWIALGSGLGRSFDLTSGGGGGGTKPQALPVAEGMTYLEYFFPGVVVMILLFTAIFSTYTVIEDRREGFLQGVLVAPIGRWSIALGKVLGGATIATIQGALFLLAWPFVAEFPGIAAMLGVGAMMLIVSVGLTALGLCIAWPMDSTAGYHAIMNLFLMPMWLLSGAAFPVSGASTWIQTVMWLNPLTYAHAAISALLHGQAQGIGAPASLWFSVCISTLFAMMLTALAAGVVSQRRKQA